MLLLPILLLALQRPAAPVPVQESRQPGTVFLYNACKLYVSVQDGYVVTPGAMQLVEYCPGYIEGYFAGLGLFDDGRVICASSTTIVAAARACRNSFLPSLPLPPPCGYIY